MNLLVSAGEASGDQHGARLLGELRKRRPVQAFGMGGALLSAGGLDTVVRSEALSVVGVSEALEKLPALWKALAALSREVERRRPDAAVLIDFPDFHALLARRLERAGVPLIYYVSPQVWAWRKGRARTIARRARRIVTLFPFEAEIYRRLGADAVCAGHPLVDDVREGLARPSPLPPKTRRRLVLLPGSRSAELERHWPAMLASADTLSRRHGLEVVAVRAPGLPESLFAGAAARGVRIVTEGLHALLATADLALVASGTATLETALCGTPMVVVYRMSASSWAIAKVMVRVRWASLANLVAEEEIVPELLQGDFTAERLTGEAESILLSPERQARMRAGLRRVAERLGPPGASGRAAQAVIEAIESGKESRQRAALP
ncbi:MAG: lipid-A-disaccharide synthase [Thermoanaerobaculia bacterium]